MSKTTKRNIIVILVAVLVAVFVSTLIGSLSDGYEDGFEFLKEENPDNLILDAKVLIEDEDEIDGFTVDVYGNNRFRIVGENDTESDVVIEVLELTLSAGTYTFSDSVEYVDGEFFARLGAIDYTNNEPATFTFDSETKLVLSIVVCPDHEIDETFYPVIVKGEKAGSFYLD